jgi:predicted Rossmann fold flavoprotein
MKNYDIAIIGAGPAGIMAAITAAKEGRKVILIEKNAQIGRKILATGNGRCNITNKNITIDRFHGASSKFIETVIRIFDQKKTIGFFESLGLILKEEDNGRIFPRTDQASTVLKALEFELGRLEVDISTSNCAKKISHEGKWKVETDKAIVFSNELILTTGGKAAFHLGSSGDGLFWAKNLGHEIMPIYAALVPLEVEELWPTQAQGIKLNATISLFAAGQEIDKKNGDLLFTHYGISGPAVMALSHLVSPLRESTKTTVKIDIFPESSFSELSHQIAMIFSIHGAKSVKNAMIGLIPSNLIPLLLKNAGVPEDKKAAEISKIEREGIVKNIKEITLTIKNTRPLREAQVSRGGIAVSEVNPDTLESRVMPNLYFAGEILDVHADSGGFNLQWAWSSGFVAGKAASKK